MDMGRRVWKCELSTIDLAFLFAGMLTVAAYFDRDTADEAEIRRLVPAGRLELGAGRRPDAKSSSKNYFQDCELARSIRRG